jgi:hypothetical protein
MCPASYHNTAQLPPSDSRMFSLDRGEFLTLEHLVIVQQLAITASFVAVPLDPLRTRAAHVVKLYPALLYRQKLRLSNRIFSVLMPYDLSLMAAFAGFGIGQKGHSARRGGPIEFGRLAHVSDTTLGFRFDGDLRLRR